MDNISPHISYAEATASSTAKSRGISNDPNPDQLAAMKQLAEKVFEPVRTHFNVPIRINSFFRSPDLNKAIGGSTTSQHCKGEAMDIDALKDITNRDIFIYIKDNLDWDQMIWEFGNDENPDWVHVSYKLSGSNRKQMLRAQKVGGRTSYVGITDAPGGSGGSSNSGSSDNGRTGTVNVSSSLNVRASGSAEARKVGSFTNGTKVNILEESNGWYHVEANGIKGWVSAKYVS